MDLTSEALKMAGALVVVLLLMGAALWVVKWVLGQQRIHGGTPELRLLGGLRLGPGKAVLLVDLAGEVMVLGSTSKELTLLTCVKDQNRVERLRPRLAGGFPGLNAISGSRWSTMFQKQSAVRPDVSSRSLK